jgi:hypothetical protein
MDPSRQGINKQLTCCQQHVPAMSFHFIINQIFDDYDDLSNKNNEQ